MTSVVLLISMSARDRNLPDGGAMRGQELRYACAIVRPWRVRAAIHEACERSRPDGRAVRSWEACFACALVHLIRSRWLV